MEELTTKGERTRAEIVQAAHRLFLKNGFHGTSMRQVAQETGIAVGGIYNHFSSKDEIFVATLKAYHPINDILPAINAAEGITVEDFVRDAARRMVDVLGNRQDFLNLIFIELVEFNGDHLPQLFATYFPQTVIFTQRFLAGRADLRSIPLPILLRAFLGLFFSYTMTGLLIGSEPIPELQEGALDYFVDIFLHGILKE